MVQISEVKGNNRENRTAAHTHIRGLGLRSDGTAEKQAGGFVGQKDAREVSVCGASQDHPGAIAELAFFAGLPRVVGHGRNGTLLLTDASLARE